MHFQFTKLAVLQPFELSNVDDISRADRELHKGWFERYVYWESHSMYHNPILEKKQN